MNTRPKEKTKWWGSNGVTFTVKETFEQDHDTWVRYQRDHDQCEYTCLLEAFLVRFTEMPS